MREPLECPLNCAKKKTQGRIPLRLFSTNREHPREREKSPMKSGS
jgi:hypothetical protein